MGGDVHKMILACSICHKAKSQFHQALYTPLPVPVHLWDDVRMDFIVALHRTQRGKDAIMVVMDRFLKMAHFTSCHKTDDDNYIVEFYFKEIIRLHGLSKTIIFDSDSKFFSHFSGVYRSYLALSSYLAQPIIHKLMVKWR